MYKTSLSLFGLLGIGLIALGLLYLSAEQFMPYHSQAVAADWVDLEPGFRGLILGLIKGLGAGAFIAGAATIFMVVASLNEGPRPFLLLMPLVAIGYSTLLGYATYTVQTSTPSNPPLLLNVLAIAAAILASVLLLLSQRNQSE